MLVKQTQALFLTIFIVSIGLSGTFKTSPEISGQPRFVFQDVSDWAGACFSSAKEFGKPGQDVLSNGPAYQTFLNNLKKDNQLAMSSFLAKAKRELTSQIQWTNNNGAFDENSIYFDTSNFDKKAPDYQHPFVQKVVIKPESKIIFIGDLHGSVHSLLRILCQLRYQKFLTNNWQVASQDYYIVFTGDLVDRGVYGLEVWYTILRLLLASPNNIFLTRGNHEAHSTMKHMGFKQELENKYPYDYSSIYKKLVQVCNCLPMALFIDCNNTIVMACHGCVETGHDPRILIKSDKKYDKISHNINPKAQALELEYLGQKKTNNYAGYNWTDVRQDKNRSNKTQQDLFQAQWSPVASNFFFPYQECLDNITYNHNRGIGYDINVHGVLSYLAWSGIALIFRGHQDQECGPKLFFHPEKQADKLGTNGLPKRELASKNNSLGKAGVGLNCTSHQPYYWPHVAGDVTTFDGNNLPTIKATDLFPVVTSTTATEGRMLPTDSFTMLTTNPEFNNWSIKIFEHKLPAASARNGCYVALPQVKDKQLVFDYAIKNSCCDDWKRALESF